MKVSVVIPLYQSSDTLGVAINSLLGGVNNSNLIKPEEIELILINDFPGSEADLTLAHSILGKTNIKYHCIQNEKNCGLATTYNIGAEASKGDLIIFMHADIESGDGAFDDLVGPFFGNADQKCVASTHCVNHPPTEFSRYCYWQQCLFSKLFGKQYCGFDGKFDCVRRESFEAIGGFDAQRFRTAGEDGDFVYRISRLGRIERTEAEILHHHRPSDFGLFDYLKKHAQYGNAQGALLRIGRIRGVKSILFAFHRELLLLGAVLPIHYYFPLYPVVVFMVLAFYSFYYTKTVFYLDPLNIRNLILPIANLAAMVFHLGGAALGVIRGRQTI